MCELLGMSANVPTDICFSFTGLVQRGGGTGPHKDGWGITFYEGKGCRTFKDPQPSYHSPIAKLVQNYPIKSCSVIAHIRQANRPFSVGFHFRYRFTVSRIFLCSFHRISLGQFTESKRKRTGDIVLSALLLLWRCSNGVFKRVSFLLAGMECYCGIMSDDAGDRIIYLPVYFRKI